MNDTIVFQVSICIRRWAKSTQKVANNREVRSDKLSCEFTMTRSDAVIPRRAYWRLLPTAIVMDSVPILSLRRERSQANIVTSWDTLCRVLFASAAAFSHNLIRSPVNPEMKIKRQYFWNLERSNCSPGPHCRYRVTMAPTLDPGIVGQWPGQ